MLFRGCLVAGCRRHLFTIPLQPVSLGLVPIIIPKLDQNNKQILEFVYIWISSVRISSSSKKKWDTTLVVAQSPIVGCCTAALLTSPFSSVKKRFLVTALGASRPRFSNKPSWAVRGLESWLDGWMVPENIYPVKTQLSIGK